MYFCAYIISVCNHLLLFDSGHFPRSSHGAVDRNFVRHPVVAMLLRGFGLVFHRFVDLVGEDGLRVLHNLVEDLGLVPVGVIAVE